VKKPPACIERTRKTRRRVPHEDSSLLTSKEQS
jgi:hypothetical protein